MGFAAPEKTLQMTPGRKTRLRLDPPITVSQCPPFGLYRSGREIARGGTEQYGTQGMYQLATGAWGLMSVQVRGSYHTERSDNFNSNLQASDYVLAPDVQAHDRNHTPSLPGLTYDTNAAATSNTMLLKAPPAATPSAAANWNTNLATAPYAIPNNTGSVVGMNSVAASAVPYPPDQAYQFKFEIPGNRAGEPGGVFLKHFGGPALNDGSGLFCVIFHGDGRAVLQEATANPPGGGDWITRATWVYSDATQAVGWHKMLIIPHRNTTGGGFIQFTSDICDRAQSGNLATAYNPAPSSPKSFIYTLRGFKQPVTIGGTQYYRPSVTGQGYFQVNHRPDMRAWFQPSVLKYLSPGTLVDLPFDLPFVTGGAQKLTITWDAVLPTGCTLTGRLYDGNTGAELSLTSFTSTSRTYSVNARQPFYFAKFTFGSDSQNKTTPLLWGYTVTSDSVYKTVAPGETQIVNTNASGLIRSVSFTGPEKDPTHETGQIGVEDLTGTLDKLSTRANIPFIFDTTYDPNDQTKRSVLGSGVISRADEEPKGTVARRGMGGSTNRVFPSPNWRHFGCTTLGEWVRLQMARTFVRLNLASSPDLDGNGNRLAYKVTDICRLMLGYAGYAPGQIDVPDCPVRFFVGASGGIDGLLVEPLTSVGDWVVKNLRAYLGWFLIWDPNAGASGMWRARPPTVPDGMGHYSPLCKLVTGAPAGKAVHKSGTYNGGGDTASPGPYVGTRTQAVTAFIKKKSFRKWVRPAEGNAVFVTGTGELLTGGDGQLRLSQWAFNVKSFDLPGVSSADATNPDYMPWFAPIVVYDPSLSEQDAVNLLTRRYYDQGCHAVKCCRLTAPCVLVVDPNDTNQTNPRPLRYYDPIQITNSKTGVTSDWLVRNCSIHFDKSGFMWMTLECEAPREVSLSA